MKIKILGTAACEGWPAIFCNCDACTKARELGGKNIRTRSSVLVDETCLIDGGFDNFMHSLYEGVDFRKINDVFITHEHEDHFTAFDFNMAFYNDLNIYGNEKVIDMLMKWSEKPQTWTGINVLKPFETVQTKDGHIFTSIKAEHNPDVKDQMNYIIEYKGKTVIFLSDTGYYKDEKTWEFISKYKFDAIIGECTCWFDSEPFYHYNFEGVKLAKQKFIDLGCTNKNTPYYLTHFSHNSRLLYDEMREVAEPFGFTICYDKMDITV